MSRDACATKGNRRVVRARQVNRTLRSAMPETEGEPRTATPASGEHPPRVRCSQCTYLLNDLPSSGLCPECGTAYDKAELEVLWHTRETAWLNPDPKAATPLAARRAMRTPFEWILVVSILTVPVGLILREFCIVLMVIPASIVAILVVIAIRTSKLTKLIEAAQDCACTNCAFDLRSRVEVGACPVCGLVYEKSACQAVWSRWRKGSE